ncbi:MAG TPA: phospho-N-acetylmuramoyl-pentapeptide-transferase [Pyrinomonadaceae bacterium]|jgi:UDP-N-acetylmuramyl pentapeptide phosphotransferase/UDP-N-acetylglucosamine-1-phosphate transferase
MVYYIFYELLYNQLKDGESYIVKALNVFQYVTFRTMYAAITALLITLFFGSRVIEALRNWNVGQQIREEGPQAHMAKRGTPTMGGVLIIASVIISTLLWAKLTNLYVWMAMLATLGFAAIGFADDYAKMAKKRSLGLTGRKKLIFQLLIAIGVWLALYLSTSFSTPSPLLRVGDVKDSGRFMLRLQEGRDPLSQYLRPQLSYGLQQEITEYDGTSTPSEAVQRSLTDELNRIMRAGTSLYDQQRFERVKLTEETRKLLGQNPQGENLVRLNRALLEEAYPQEIAKNQKYSWNVNIPFFKATAETNPYTAISYIGPWLYLALVIIVLLGSSNAVNLTDGLDGLAISITFIATAALTAFTYLISDARWARYLDLSWRPEAAELTVFCGAMVGASLGFLWFNAPPAEVFMGDVGSLAIGGAIGTIAVLTKQEFMLLMVGGVFVIEALSVMLQVVSFKMTGRRIFKMSPLHHHFELQGWRESKVVFRFLILAILFALLSLSTLKLR